MSSNLPNNRKRPFSATFRTLNDLTSHSAYGPLIDENDPANSNSNDSSSGNGGSNRKKIAIQHIPSLPNDKQAATILRRIHSEFHTLIQRRGWNITSITEMCCCGDGIDCLKKNKQRKTKIMPNNVLGYNRTSFMRGRGNNVHDIHSRLRHPKTHELLEYEDIAGTMCHELAHCVRGPHDAKFYKAMEEIEEQYAIYLAKGVVLDKDGFPIGSNEAHVLGRSGGGNNNIGRNRSMTPLDRRKALETAESRRKKNQNGLTHGYVLGGKSSLTKQRDPKEAARIAAERRLLDSQYCLPCNEIIELLGEDSSEGESDDEVEVVDVGKKPAKVARVGSGGEMDEQGDKSDTDDSAMNMKPKARSDTTESSDVIDLTLDDSFTVEPPDDATLKPASTSNTKSRQNQNVAAQPKTEQSAWTCPRCTLTNPPIIIVPNACCLERPCNKTILEQAKELKKEDDIAYIKEREVQQSMESFGGFNIYGEKKNASSAFDLIFQISCSCNRLIWYDHMGNYFFIHTPLLFSYYLLQGTKHLMNILL